MDTSSYKGRVFPDGDSWLQVLRECRANHTNFIDFSFPPELRSIYVDPQNPRNADLAELRPHITWKRVLDLFEKVKFFKLSFAEGRTMEWLGFSRIPNPAAFKDMTSRVPSDSIVTNQNDYLNKSIAILRAGIEGGTSGLESAFEAEPLTPVLVKNNTFDKLKTEFFELSFAKIEESHVYPGSSNGTVDVILTIIYAPMRVDVFQRSNPKKPLVEPGDVLQGQLGDCYLLGALSVLSTDQEVLFSVFPDIPDDLRLTGFGTDDDPPGEQQFNPEGVYAVRFWREGRWCIVVVDDYIPCDSRTGRPAFAKCAVDSTEIWCMIAEKAYAKLNGSYEMIIGGFEEESLQDLTGGIPMKISLSGQYQDPRFIGPAAVDTFWNHMKRLRDEGSLIGCSKVGDTAGSHAASPEGILYQHAYGVLKLQEITFGSKRERLMQVRNPWGSGLEWNGSWCDSDTKWSMLDDHVKQELGYSNEADGTWWMTVEDFMASFDHVEICRTKPMTLASDASISSDSESKWHYHQCVGEWKGDLAAGQENMHLNPMWQLKIEPRNVNAAGINELCELYIEILQPSKRPLNLPDYDKFISPVLAKGFLEGQRPLPNKIENVCKANFRNKWSVVMETSVESGLYTIIASTFDPGQCGQFLVRVFTSLPSTCIQLPFDAITRCAYSNEVVRFPFRSLNVESVTKDLHGREWKLLQTIFVNDAHYDAFLISRNTDVELPTPPPQK